MYGAYRSSFLLSPVVVLVFSVCLGFFYFSLFIALASSYFASDEGVRSETSKPVISKLKSIVILLELIYYFLDSGQRLSVRPTSKRKLRLFPASPPSKHSLLCPTVILQRACRILS